jgi:anti-sigma regulatory factor (Ser/Thr protein kinase)
MSELARASDWLAVWADQRRMPKDVVFAIRLCLEEVLANIVMHAFDGGEHAILLSIRSDVTEVVVSVEDDGRPFDILATPNTTMTAVSLVEAESGGRGLSLIKAYANHLAYRHDGGWNHLLMAFTRVDDKPTPDR